MRFYIALLSPHGWIARVMYAVVTIYAAIDVWRNEGPDGWQPPKLFDDVIGWLPWPFWIIIVLVAVVVVVAENSFRLHGASVHQSAPESQLAAVEKLASLIEQGDDQTQQIMRQGLVDDDWEHRAEGFVQQFGVSALADFRTAREPTKRASGSFTHEVWQRLDRTMAQLEVLRRLKDEVEKGTRAAPATQIKWLHYTGPSILRVALSDSTADFVRAGYANTTSGFGRDFAAVHASIDYFDSSNSIPVACVPDAKWAGEDIRSTVSVPAGGRCVLDLVCRPEGETKVRLWTRNGLGDWLGQSPLFARVTLNAAGQPAQVDHFKIDIPAYPHVPMTLEYLTELPGFLR